MYICKYIYQASISDLGDIAYIDVVDGSSLAHVRCANIETAQKLSAASLDGISSVLLTGQLHLVEILMNPRFPPPPVLHAGRRIIVEGGSNI